MSMRRALFRVLALAGPWWLCSVAASVGSIAQAADGGVTPALVLAPAKSSQACFEVRGLPSDVTAELRRLPSHDSSWAKIFNVRVAATATSDQPPMLGSYEPTGDGVRFRPRFPLK